MKKNNKIIYTSSNLDTDNNYILIGTTAGCTIYDAEKIGKRINLSKSN